MKRLKTKEIHAVRQQLLLEQGSLCALCQRSIDADAVLDHDHKTGLIRAALHRQCNAFLGRIENNGPRHGIKLDQLGDFLRNTADYLDTHSSDQTGLLHPTYRTEPEKVERRKAKAKLAYKRRKEKALQAKDSEDAVQGSCC